MTKYYIAKFETELVVLDNVVPNAIQLLPIGDIVGRDKRHFRLSNPESVILETRLYMKKTEGLIDYNHQSEYSKQNGQPAPAAGWMTDFYVADDYLWAKVDWTDKAAEYIKNREFRYISPVFYHTKDGEIISIVSAGLTNTPNLELKALNQIEENEEMDKETKALCQALGTPDEKQALDRVTALQVAEKALNEIAAALSCDPTKEAVLKAVNETKADPAKFIALDKFVELSKDMAALKAERQAEKALNAVESAVKDGRLPPALKENAQAVYEKMGEVAFNELISKMPGVSGVAVPSAQPAPTTATGLSEEEKAMCQAMGITEEIYKKGRA